MKNYSWILVAAAIAPLVPLACGSDTTSSSTTSSGGATGAGGATVATGSNTTGSNTTGSNTTGSNTTGSNTTTTTTTTSTGTGGGEPVDCSGIFNAGTCGTCVEAKCCQELADCNDDGECLSCFDGSGDPETCAVNGAAEALTGCMDTDCKIPCSCNPVTGDGCDVAGGATCDLEQGGSFVCFGPPNNATLCGACDNGPGPYCGAGLSCLGGLCARYCCTDEDCGTGKCDGTVGGGEGVGVCVTAADNKKPSCDAPKVSVSMGTCYGMPSSSSSASSSSASSSSASSSSASSSSASSSSASSSSASSSSASSSSASSSSASSSSASSGSGSSSSTGP